MDPVTLGMAKADAKKKYAFTNPQATIVHRALKEATVDLNFLVVGDSTGASLTRWARLLCNRIAAEHPTWTIVYAPFDDGTKTYPVGSRQTVQAGTNGRTLTLWNASLSGSAIGYARDNISTIVAPIAAADMVLINYGHNSPQLGDDYRAVHLETVLLYQRKYAKALFVLMTQNPRATTDPAYNDGQSKNRAIYELAMSRGFCMVDVNRAFIDYGNYAADLLLPDGLHPNDTKGSPLWADLVWQGIRPTGVTVTPGPQPVGSRVWVPASQFYAVDGAPSLVLDSASKQQGWSLDPATEESVACSVTWPDAWKRQNAYLYWVTPTSVGAGSAVRWETTHMYTDAGSVTLGAWANPLPVTSTAPATSAFMRQELVWNRNALGRVPLSVKVKRVAADAADTLATDAVLLGMLIEAAY